MQNIAWLNQTEIVFEEAFELIGAVLILLGFLTHCQKLEGQANQ